ncbi:MAG: polysaccharide biosynthesis protein [Clostridia bacterium]|jgi:stage V sporulation protein B|nr:polysaccharide biosynthesis protein [Clostridia bacterium]
MGNKSFFGQATMLAIAIVVVRFLGFLYRVPLTGMLGDKGIGWYSAAFQIYTFFFIMSAFSLPASISKIVSENIAIGRYKNAHKVFKVAYKISLFLGFLMGAILLFGSGLFANLLRIPETKYAMITLGPTLFVVAAMVPLRGYFQGMGDMYPTASSQVVEQFFNAIFSVVMAYVLLTNFGLAFGAAGGTLGTGIGALAGLIYISIMYLKRKKDIFKNIDEGDQYEEDSKVIAKNMLGTMIPFIIGNTVFTFTVLIDVIMVKTGLLAADYTNDAADVIYGQWSGKYSLIINLPTSIITAIVTAIIPNIAAAKAKGKFELIRAKFERLIKVIFVVMMPTAIGLMVMGSNILELLFPRNPGGGQLFVVGGFTVVLVGIMKISTATLQGMGEFWKPVKYTAIAMATKVLLNFTLIRIPEINIYGAIIAGLIAYSIISYFNIREINKKLNMKVHLLKYAAKPFIASLIMGIFTYGIYYAFSGISQNLATVISVAGAVIIYGVLVIKFKILSKEEILILPKGEKIVKVLKI